MTPHTTKEKSEKRKHSGILENKRAVVFGAGGSIGQAVAREFAAEGAQVFLAGRTRADLEGLVREIHAAGGRAEAAVVDATDDPAVGDYLDGIVERSGGIDIILDVSGPRAKEYGNGKAAVELPVEEFLMPLTTMLKSRFVTARCAARHMTAQGSGVIIFVTGSPARGHVPGATAIGSVFGAMEALVENLAVEVSPCGVRVVCLRTLANTDSRSIQETMEIIAGKMSITKDQAMSQIAASNFLKVPAGVADTANAAVLIASDRARMLTATVVNATAGAAAD